MSRKTPEDAAGSRATGITEQSWIKAAPAGTGLTVLAIHFSPLVPEPALIASALRDLQRSHPILRARLNTSSSALSISKEPYITLETVGTKPTADILAAEEPASKDVEHSRTPFRVLLRRELNRNPWSGKSSDPAVIFATFYSLPGEHAVLALRLHSAVADRTAGLAVVGELLRLIKGGPPKVTAAGSVPTSPALPLTVEELIPSEHGKKAFWTRGKDMLGYSLNFTRSSMLTFDDTKSARSTDLVEMELSPDETRKLLDCCDKMGIKLCHALTAAALMATASSKGLRSNKSESYGVITFVDCRSRLSKPLTDKDIGFYNSAIQNIHTVTGADALWDLAKRCHTSLSDSIARNKHFVDMADLNYMMQKAIQAPQLTPSGSMRTALLSVCENPLIYDSSDLYMQSAGVEDFVSCFSVHGVGPSIAVLDSIRDGRLSCACMYPTPLHSRKRMVELAENMKRVLVAGTGTVSK